MLLVSIVGDFHSSIFPLYNELKEKIHHHIVVDDDAFNERRKHKQIVKSLQNFNEKYNLDITTETFTIDEDSLPSIEKLIKRIEELSPNLKDVYINITDGLANIGMALAGKLLPKGVKFLSYDMYENSYNVTTQENIKTFHVQKSLSIEDHFLLKGMKIQKQNKEFAHRYQPQILELFNTYADEMKWLNKDITNKTDRHKDQYQKALQLVQNMGLDIKKDAPMITGGLFEYYVYLLIKDLNFDDIEIGVVAEQPFYDKEITIKNEFDILLMKNNHLHIIECKFRDLHTQDRNKLVYKYISLIDLIDDDSKMMIVTNEETYRQNIFDENNKGLSDYRRGFLNRVYLRGSIIKSKELFLNEVQTLFL